MQTIKNLYSISKILLATIAASFFLSLTAQPALALPTDLSEAITSFDSLITINKDTSITIKETVVYETTSEKHGIYRYIPEYYHEEGYKKHLPISKITVTDETGLPIQYEKNSENNSVFLKIGDPYTTFSGEKTYIITYTIARALDRFETHDELYWDITGEGWSMPILNTTAKIVSPHAQMTELACYSGYIGENDTLCSADQDTFSISYPVEVNYNENVTIALKLDPENELAFPSEAMNQSIFIANNWTIGLLPLPLLMIIWIWWTKGRDYAFVSANVYNLDPSQPQRKVFPSMFAREPLVYAPLDMVTPGQAGVLLNEKVTPVAIISEILELARKKYLKIEAMKTPGLVGKLFGEKTDYLFTKLKDIPTDTAKNSASVTAVQALLFKKIFANRDSISVSKLKGTFYTTMQAAQNLLEDSLVKEKLYTSKPSEARGLWITVFVICFGIMAGLLVWQFGSVSIYWPLVFAIPQLPFGVWLAYNMPQKTAVGTNVWLQTRGLRKSIRYGAWREKIKEKHLFIEEVFPFAVALGVVDSLARDMEKLNIQPPEYLSSGALNSLSSAAFVNSFSKEVGSSLSYNPSSSSSSGGGGFSGGSSGGGGGGGGGGSW